ncbi:MAG: homoserine dehydrogenase [Opitutaceae bacterium]|jgi:homoserine dehydrogenase
MSPARTLNIGLCGLGTVGQGVWKHFGRMRSALESRLGARIVLYRAAVRSRSKERAVRVPASRLTGDAMAVATDPAVHIVCELMGGTGIARDVTLAALSQGKVVVSANKALICEHGAEIFAAARRGGGHFLFEASVAGGIPLIKAVREGLVANRFPRIYGILNGTCNYILTKMEELDAPYASVLREAKRLGYAEKEESLDVEGWDTAHKACILAWLAHGVWVRPRDMIVEGIERITPADFKNAAALGFGIKLLGIITRDFATNEISVRVHPTLLPEGGVLARVSGVFNAISVTGDVVGTTLYIGRGAGQDATASAVISDIADAVALLLHGKGAHFMGEEEPPALGGARMAPPERIHGRHYVRLTVADRPGVLARVATVMARNRISIASVIQNPSERPGAASLVLTTHESDERSMGAALRALARLGSVREAPLHLRIGDLDG